MTNSTTSNESALRSSTNLLSILISCLATPSCSLTIPITFSSIDTLKPSGGNRLTHSEFALSSPASYSWCLHTRAHIAVSRKRVNREPDDPFLPFLASKQTVGNMEHRSAWRDALRRELRRGASCHYSASLMLTQVALRSIRFSKPVSTFPGPIS